MGANRSKVANACTCLKSQDYAAELRQILADEQSRFERARQLAKEKARTKLERKIKKRIWVEYEAICRFIDSRKLEKMARRGYTRYRYKKFTYRERWGRNEVLYGVYTKICNSYPTYKCVTIRLKVRTKHSYHKQRWWRKEVCKVYLDWGS